MSPRGSTTVEGSVSIPPAGQRADPVRATSPERERRADAGAIVLSTAGDVGHGKTALVHRLTVPGGGALEEQPRRGPSIDPHLAYYELDGVRHVVVDLPGHERFSRSMLADGHGIDLVLLVIAADAGVTPQAREHFDVARLLGVRRLVLVVSKIDLVDDARVREVQRQAALLARDTAGAPLPVCAVSSLCGTGIDQLRAELARQIAGLVPREARGWFRMPIDRSFTLPGEDLVVTGTVLAGALCEGDELALRPGDASGRARSIQVHGERVREARAGQRIAIHWTGAEAASVQRGQLLADPRVEFTTDRIDGWLELRADEPQALRSFDQVRFYAATAEVAGRVIVLGAADEIAPGASAFCQIALDGELILASGDRFLLRPQGAPRIVAGGTVVHPFASRHHAEEADPLARLQTLREGPLPERVHALLDLLHEVVAPPEFVAQALDRSVAEVLGAARASDRVVVLPAPSEPRALATRANLRRLDRLVVEALERFREAHPQATGMELEALRSRLRVPIPPRVFGSAVGRLEADGLVTCEGDLVRLSREPVAGRPPGEDLPARLEHAILAGGLTPPDRRQLEAALGIPAPRLAELVATLESAGTVVRIAPDLWLGAGALAQARRILLDFLREHAEITVSQYRDLLSASRKYALALAEFFDRSALTIRVGDARRLRP